MNEEPTRSHGNNMEMDDMNGARGKMSEPMRHDIDKRPGVPLPGPSIPEEEDEQEMYEAPVSLIQGHT